MSDDEIPTVYSNLHFAEVPPADNKIKTVSFFSAFASSKSAKAILHNVMYSNHPEFNPLEVETLAPQFEKALPCYVSPFSILFF
jgi:hypothetical protein